MNTIDIRQGRNTLLVKTLNNYGDYTFALNICEVESDPNYYGNRVAGLKFYIDMVGVNKVEEVRAGIVGNPECYPNPAADHCSIRSELAAGGRTNLDIYDLNGKPVRSLWTGVLSGGPHEFAWNLENGAGTRVPAGLYLCSLRIGNRKSRPVSL